MSYQQIQSQPSRLGEFAGEFGSTSDATAVINAIGTSVVGALQAIEGGRTLRKQASEEGKTARTSVIESTKKLAWTTKGQIGLAREQTENIKATYGSITKLVIGAGAVLSGLLIAGAVAFSLVKGDDDYIYE
jgi:hypothetical protein